MLTLMLVGVVLMGLFGSPLFLVIGGLAILLFPESKIPISSIVIEMDKLTEKAFFIPIPMFTFAGYVLAKSKSPKRIVDVVEAWFGWASGGLAIVALFTCAFFTTTLFPYTTLFRSFPTRRSSDLIGRASCRERV